MRPFHIAFIVVLSVGLTVAPPSHAQSQIVSAGYDIPGVPIVSPGQVITLFVRGIHPPDAFATKFPLPTTLAGTTVHVKTNIPGYPDRLPIFSIRSYDSCGGNIGIPCLLTHVTVQIPVEPTCIDTGKPNECTIGGHPAITLVIEENGISGQDFLIFPLAALLAPRPQILNACQTIFGTIGGICNAFVTHADGSLVSVTSPAHSGETVAVYAVGLGMTQPVKTGEATPSPSLPAAYTPPLIISHRIVPSGRVRSPIWLPMLQWFQPEFLGLVPGYVGLSVINVKLPSVLPEGVVPCPPGIDNTRIAIDPLADGTTNGATYVDICVTP